MQNNSTTYKFIEVVPYSDLVNWSVQYLKDSSISFNKKYPLVSISTFLKRNKTAIEIENDKEYKRATIKVRNGGIFLRDIEKGQNIGTKNQFTIKEGQFLLSKIDARNGAFGVVPSELDGGIITGNFWTFDVDYSKVNPHYLSLVATTPEFIKFSEQASNGTTNRHYLQEDAFLNIRIPLPSIDEQNKIYNAFLQRMQLAEQLEIKANEIGDEIENYLFSTLGVAKKGTNEPNKSSLLSFISFKEIERWAISHINKNQKFSFKAVKYEIKPIKQLLMQLDGGKTPSTTRKEFWDGDVNWFSAKDMKDLYLKDSEDKITTIAVKNAGMKIHSEGTILGVFRSGILRHSFPVAMLLKPASINQDLKAMSFNNSLVYNEYMLFYLNIFQELILEQAQKTGVTVESINTYEFLEIPIVVPELAIQLKITNHISKLKVQINQLKHETIQNRSIALKEFENEIFKN
jgi:restriction endonuclease S subunit